MPPVYSTKDLTIHTTTREVYKENECIKLPHLSYQTLVVLLEHHPNTVSFDQLMDEVWQGLEVSQETVTQRIALLRKALGSDGEAPDTYIASIRSVGYRWVPEVSSNESIKTTSTRYRRLIIVSAFFLFITCAVLSYKHLTQKTKQAPPLVTSIKAEYIQQAWKYLKKHDHRSNELALGLFRKALEATPQNAEAMVGISLALSHQVTKFNQPDQLLIEAKDMALAATRLDPQNTQSWLALGFVYDAQGEIQTAIKYYLQAIELDPDSVSANSSLAYLYTQSGNLVSALKINIAHLGSSAPYIDLQIANTLELLAFDRIAEAWYQKADELSPDSVFATQQRAKHLIATGDFRQAKHTLSEALERDIQRPEIYVILGLIEWMEHGLNEQSRSHFSQALEVDQTHFEANLWYFLSKEQITEQQKLTFEKQWLSSTVNWPDQGVFKSIYLSHFGKTEASISQLESAFDAGYRNHRWIQKLPPFEALLNDDDFQQILEKMRDDVDRQREQVLASDWLPTSFLDPQSY